MLYFEIDGANTGTIYGTDVYTHDSNLATAAVHAGVLKLHERGIVKVTILPPSGNFKGEDAADVEILAENVPHHVGRRDPFGRGFVMFATRRMDVVVAADPAQVADLDPALEAERFAVRLRGRDGDRAL